MPTGQDGKKKATKKKITVKKAPTVRKKK